MAPAIYLSCQRWTASSACLSQLRRLHEGPVTQPTEANCGLLSELYSLGSYETKVAFTDFANWLIPGTLLVGRYPYVEPSRCLRREQGEAQLTRILEQNITTFVSLQVRRDQRVRVLFKTVMVPVTGVAARSSPPLVPEPPALPAPPAATA